MSTQFVIILRKNSITTQTALPCMSQSLTEANCEDEDCKYSGTKEYFNRTPLLIAIDQGNREIVELLIRNHADINFITTAGESAFGLALKNDNNELIQLLLDAGVDINLHSNNVTSLHWAVARNNYPIAEYLINKGADVNTVCHYPPRECFNTCCSALHVAVKNKNKDMIELLLKNNADVNIKANCDETTPCHFPVRDYFNRTPLHIAVDKEDKEVVKLLIKNKADVNISTRTGETALGIAVKKNNFALVKLLLNADAEINSSNESPLHLAIKRRHYKMAEYLLNRGADFNIRDSGGAVINLQCADEDFKVVIKRHIVKLEAANLYAGSYLCEIGDGFDWLYRECYHEIKLMRKTCIGKSNLTFYNLLTMCQHKLALRLKHVDVNYAGSVLKGTARSKFPLYGEMKSFHLFENYQTI
ncbi:putative ankyrin repeat protein RF_0381 [Microplitis demolitor]|uniref:putative ankyrin repeat protein RF_0381 n=1 Tax=Microplitis demolitor TaxID=69319 RepID=UPI00235B5FB6|nr:putative ankyrin repeat protein RF_0381 [Microplitis demolitor]